MPLHKVLAPVSVRARIASVDLDEPLLNRDVRINLKGGGGGSNQSVQMAMSIVVSKEFAQQVSLGDVFTIEIHGGPIPKKIYDVEAPEQD